MESYKQCNYCVMDTTDPDISFDKELLSIELHQNSDNRFKSNRPSWTVKTYFLQILSVYFGVGFVRCVFAYVYGISLVG